MGTPKEPNQDNQGVFWDLISLLNPRSFGTRMKLMKTIYSLILTILLSPLAWSQSTNLKVGDKAPDFELQDQDGNAVRLSDFSGKKNVALAFYVFAFTRG